MPGQPCRLFRSSGYSARARSGSLQTSERKPLNPDVPHQRLQRLCVVFVTVAMSSLLSGCGWPVVVLSVPRQRRDAVSPRYMHARVAKLADAQDLGSCGVTRAGSIPASRILLFVKTFGEQPAAGSSSQKIRSCTRSSLSMRNRIGIGWRIPPQRGLFQHGSGCDREFPPGRQTHAT